MIRRALAALAAIAGLSAVVEPATAATGAAWASSEASYSIWNIEGTAVRVRVEVPLAAARKLDAPGSLPPGAARVASAVSQAVSVTTPSGDCEAIDQGEGVGQIYTLALTPGLYRYEIVFACPQAESLTLNNRLLIDRDPNHVDYARIAVRDRDSVVQTFTKDRPFVVVEPGNQPAGAGPVDFARRAAVRLASSVAALGVLFGSLLLCRRWFDLVWLGAALGAGALASIVIAVPGLVVLDQRLANAMIGELIMALGLAGLLSPPESAGRPKSRAWLAAIALVALGLVVTATVQSLKAGLATAGVGALALASLRGGTSHSRLGWLRFGLAALFALLQGLSLASDLERLHPAVSQLASIVAGAETGVMLAGMAMLAGAMALAWLAARRLGALRTFGSETGGAALIGLGLFWFVSRLHS